jgi:predicted PurR-regulated permease PerM
MLSRPNPITTPRHATPPADVKQAPVVYYTFMLIGLSLLVFVLHKLDSILLPLLFSALFALLLLPVARWFERRGFGRVWAIIMCLLLLSGLFAGLVYGFGSQLGQFKSELPKLQTKLLQFFHDGQEWAARRFGIDPMSEEELKDSTLNYVSTC